MLALAQVPSPLVTVSTPLWSAHLQHEFAFGKTAGCCIACPQLTCATFLRAHSPALPSGAAHRASLFCMNPVTAHHEVEGKGQPSH